MKKLLTILALMLACVGQVFCATYDFTVGGIYYHILDETERTVEVTYGSYSSATATYNITTYQSGDIVVPSSVTYNNKTYSVIRIGDNAFRNATIPHLTIPKTVLALGEYSCFSPNIDNVKILEPSELFIIGKNAFDMAGKQTIIIPNKVTVCEFSTFSGNTKLQNLAVLSPTPPVNYTYRTIPWYPSPNTVVNLYVQPQSLEAYTEIWARSAENIIPIQLTVNPTQTKIQRGQTVSIQKTMNADIFDVSWSSSNEDIATVDQNGLVTSKKDGEVVITARVVGTEVTSSCSIRILEHVPSKAPTCTQEGNIEYWSCGDKCFSDANGTNEIPANTTIKSSLGHDLIFTDNEDGTHHVACSRCSYVKEEEHTYNGIECTLCGAKAPRTCSFDFSAPSSLGITPSDEVDGDVEVTEPITNGQLTLTADNAVEVTFDGPEYKLEVGRAGTLEIAAKSPDIIKKIEFGVGSDIEQVTANCGILDGLVWTGKAGSVTFSVEDVRNAFAQFTTITVWYESNTWEIEDGQPYTVSENVEHQAVNYTRNFSSTNWQALYVPFSMKYDDWKDKLDVYDIYNVLAYDEDNNGEIERTTVNMIRLKEGAVTEPNCPYVVRAKNAGDVEITLTDGTLYAAEENSIDCTSTKQKFTFTGTYEPMTGLATKGYYALSGGELKTAIDDAVTLKPQRWYMEVTNRNGSPAAATRVYLNPFGEENEVEGVKGVAVNIIGEETTYDLNGRAVNAAQLPKGLYVRGGKKIIVK